MNSGQHQEAIAHIAYEQPLNERVRTFLRLEFLFGLHTHHAADPSNYGFRARLAVLLDILTVLSRSDLKKDILKELLEQQTMLMRMASRPGVDQSRLEGVLTELQQSINAMQGLQTHFAVNALRDNEFLLAVNNRASIPGGTCAFDLPGYHHWLSQVPEQVQADCDGWYADIRPFEEAIRLYLSMLRASTELLPASARDGVYIHVPNGPCQMVRVLVDAESAVFPEISAGAHRFTIRFMHQPDVHRRPTQQHSAVQFRLQCCAL